MGKLGGRELNYSSDIDVIFLYGEEGFVNPRFSYHEFFTRLAEKIVGEFAARGNALFRIDLRLRPEGSSGPLVRGLASTENYYAGYGETWERMALIKARGIAGDEELLYEFEHRLQPFIFPKAVSDELLTEIAD
jgi:glutamate-ammonia-ligase adenylyltransferase